MNRFNDRSRAYRNILIIKPGAIGDVLQLSPVIRALKQAFSDAAITVMVGSSSTADLFRYNPRVDETIVFDRRGAHRSLPAVLSLWLRLHRRKYDLVINFQRSNMMTWLLAAASFPCRVLVYHKARNRTIHAVTNYLETIVPLGISASDLDLDLHPGPEARARAAEILAPYRKNGEPLVALNPGASSALKQWDIGKFAALADILARDHAVKSVIVGGPDDVALSEEIARRTTARPLDLTGKLNILELGAVLEQCSAVVSGDTGPMHVATAVGTPVMGLFGPTDPARTGPVGRGHVVLQAQGVACVPCRDRTCRNPRYLECMDKITPEAVAGAITTMLKAGRKDRGPRIGV